MTDEAHLALIHAEIDGELDPQQRAELARWLLADPTARVVREDLRRTCTVLDQIQEVAPPPQLRPSVLAALPQETRSIPGSRWSPPRLRYAAAIVGVLTAAALVYVTVHGPTPAIDGAGTMAPGMRTTLDTVSVSSAAVSGRLGLYRDSAGLGLECNLKASAPVDLVVTAGAQTLRFKAVSTQGRRAAESIALPGLGTSVQAVEVTLLMDGRVVGSATLHGADNP